MCFLRAWVKYGIKSREDNTWTRIQNGKNFHFHNVRRPLDDYAHIQYMRNHHLHTIRIRRVDGGEEEEDSGKI